MRVDDEPEFRRRSRMVVIGNCGRLLGGLVLMPSALVDDGRLDAVIASPRGLVGWVPVATRVATRQRKGHPTLDHKVCTEIRVASTGPCRCRSTVTCSARQPRSRPSCGPPH